MSCIPRNRGPDNIRHSRNRFRKHRWGKNSRYIAHRKLCRLKSGEVDSWRKCICIRICNCNIGNDHHRRRRRRSVPMCKTPELGRIGRIDIVRYSCRRRRPVRPDSLQDWKHIYSPARIQHCMGKGYRLFGGCCSFVWYNRR